MVVIMNSDATQAEIEGVIRAIKEKGLEAKVMEGAHQKIVGVIGDKTKLAATPLDAMHGVETTISISKSYKLASRESVTERLSSWRAPVPSSRASSSWRRQNS